MLRGEQAARPPPAPPLAAHLREPRAPSLATNHAIVLYDPSLLRVLKPKLEAGPGEDGGEAGGAAGPCRGGGSEGWGGSRAALLRLSS